MTQIRLHKAMIPDDLNIKDILRTKQVSNGKYVRKLEHKLRQIHKVDYAICFANCTTATLLTFYALNIKKVAMPSFTWISTKTALDMLDIKIYNLNIEKDTFLVSKDEQQKLEDKVDFFFLTSTFGNKPDVLYPEKTILDSAHCTGHKGFGNLAKVELLSFSPMKTFTGIEGGAVLTNDVFLASELIVLQKYFGRMSEINAKVVLYNLNRRKQIFSWKHKVFNEYKRAFGTERFQKINEYSTLNEITLNIESYTDEQRDELCKKIEVRQRYNPNDVHRPKGYERNTNAKTVCDNNIILPSYLNCNYKKVIRTLKRIENDKKYKV